MSGNRRQAWIISQIPLAAGDSVLELGCGHGVAATAICARLGNGSYHGIDRSPTMTAAATRRNIDHVEAGRARFDTTTILEARLDEPYDWVVAIHFPPIERGDATPTLAVVRRALGSDCRLAIGFQPHDPAALPVMIEHINTTLAGSGFATQPPIHGRPDDRATVVILARRPLGLREAQGGDGAGVVALDPDGARLGFDE